MSNNPFTQFISLITLDHTIQSFITKKASIDAVITEINNKKNEQEVVINDIAKKVMQFKKNVDSQELEMKALDQQEKEKKQLLSKLTDYKECQSVKTAVDGIQRLQVAQEKSVLDAWNQLENAQLLLAKKQAESRDSLDAIAQELENKEQEKTSVIAELDNLSHKREALLEGIPQEWLDKYGIMGQRVANPVVPIEQQSCGGCYQQLVVQDLVRARHGALLQCKKCFRLLYLPEYMDQKSA